MEQLHISRDNFVVLILYSSCRGQKLFQHHPAKTFPAPLKVARFIVIPFLPRVLVLVVACIHAEVCSCRIKQFRSQYIIMLSPTAI